MAKNKYSDVKNYTLQVPEDLVIRMWYLRDISKKKFDPNSLINKFIYEAVKEYENKFNIDENDYKKSFKCEKCNHFMKKIKYKDKMFWGCSNYPKCKNTKPIKE